jgi:hypothetical protein
MPQLRNWCKYRGNPTNPKDANVSTTQAHYILPDRKETKAALRKLERVSQKK